MTVPDLVVATINRVRGLPTALRYTVTAVLVLLTYLAREAAAPWLPEDETVLIFYIPILVAAALFDHGAGLLAVALSAVIAATWLMAPTGQMAVEDPRQLVQIGLFVAIGGAMAFVIEALHRAVAGQRAANAGLLRAERRRELLLHEFRHRTRNDLASLAGLLHLRARAAASEQVRDGLREAAQHAMALARVHTRLAAADIDDGALIDTRVFLQGLASDLGAAVTGKGLRPVALVMEAESHTLDAERAVQLGLVLNETVTNALKYAFPDDHAGGISVAFRAEGADFVLRVADDGIGLHKEDEMNGGPPPPVQAGSGLGTRLLRALAAQLRGSFTRIPGTDGKGAVAELRFPVAPPGAPREMAVDQRA